MTHFILIFVCLLIGVVLRQAGRLPMTTPLFLNRGVIYLSLPALILVQIPVLLQSTPIDRVLFIPLSMAWMLVLLSLLVFSFAGKKLGWDKKQTGSLILTSGLANTSFVGIPLLQAVVGEKAIPIGIIIDQAGSFLALSTLGFGIAAYYSGNRVSVTKIAKRILYFPPFLTLVAAIVWGTAGVQAPTIVMTILKAIAATLVPCALISVGLQVQVSRAIFKQYWTPLALGLVFKLILAPLLFTGLYIGLLGARDFAAHVTILQAAMAPMITAAIVATQFELDKELAGLMVGVGIPLSMVTVPLWNFLLLSFV